MNEDTGIHRNTADFDGYIFRKSLPLQIELHEIQTALGNASDMACLEIGGTNAMFSYQLRRAGGQWHTLTMDEATARRLRDEFAADADVMPAEDDRFPKFTFDAVIVAGGILESQQAEGEFIRRCHRMLKSDGRLILCTERSKRFSLISLFRKLLPVSIGTAYTESRLFGVLKNGFDVSNVRTYMRFFTTSVDIGVQALLRRHSGRTLEELQKFYLIAGVFYWIAFQLDALLLFTRGHRLIAVAGRRGWRSREAPVLSDGRSISEAVLRPIG